MDHDFFGRSPSAVPAVISGLGYLALGVAALGFTVAGWFLSLKGRETC